MKNKPPVSIAATYKSSWDDGFGARGWKIDASIGDPMVIASTSETGDKIPTSVLVHDMLDHHLCGLKLSGHRNEAIALNLLAQRTDSSPIPDYTQMTEEDILRGNVNGETMHTFLPDDLIQLIPQALHEDDKQMINYLKQQLGEENLKTRIIERFVELGNAGLPSAKETWQKTGLEFKHRKQIGLCIQKLLEQFDAEIETNNIESVHAEFKVSDDLCVLLLESDLVYQQPINSCSS